MVRRLRDRFGRRVTGAVAALAIEALLLLLLLTVAQSPTPRKEVPLAVTSFDVKDQAAKAPQPPKQREPKRQATAARRPPQPVPSAEPTEPAPAARPAAIIPVSPQQMASLDIANLPRRESAPTMGPAFTPRPGDSQRVGTTPGGQPMYAARWYREPTDQELRGYLSTATGPAWGLITCKTVADFRVEDCVGLDEYPQGSHMLRAILAAAWQFRVRPPQIGGVPQVGDWVRIRIEYDLKPADP